MKKSSFTKSLSVPFPNEIYRQIMQVAEMDGIPMEDWVRYVCENALYQKQLILEEFQRHLETVIP